jgi:hypothetical protein
MRCQWVGSFSVGFTVLVVGCSDGPMYPSFEDSSNGGNGGSTTVAAGGRPDDPVFNIGSGGSAGAPNDCSAILWDSRSRDGGAPDAAHTARNGNDGGRLDVGAPRDGAVSEAGAVSDARTPADAASHTGTSARGTPASCRLPLNGIGRLDLEPVSITLSVDDSFQGFILRVASCGVDGGATGIAYDDPVSPTAFVLCPSSCEWFMTHPARITAHFSCREYANPW